MQIAYILQKQNIFSIKTGVVFAGILQRDVKKSLKINDSLLKFFGYHFIIEAQ